VAERPAPTVAIVDDNPASRGLASARLEAEGLQVVASVSHGTHGMLAVRDAAPSIVFVAFEHPILRAVQSLDFLSSALAKTPILAYASSEEVSVFQQAIRAGARHLLHAPLEPDDVERALAAVFGRRAPSASKSGRVISIVGQKGGIGKTALSINLASALARDTRGSVLIMDFDTNFGDVGLSLDTNSPSTVAQAALGISQLDTHSFKEAVSEHESGAFVLSAPAHVGEWLHVQPCELEALVEVAASLFDYVVVDTPGAYNDAVASAIAVSDTLLIVTSLEIMSVKNTSVLLGILQEEGYPEGRSQVIVNNTDRDTGLKITDSALVLERDSIWNVPYDPLMRRAGSTGTALVLTKPSSPASQSICALAHRIAAEPNRIDRRRALRDETPQKRASFRARMRAALSKQKAAAAG
jgi:pilus assembly protein CpaE